MRKLLVFAFLFAFGGAKAQQHGLDMIKSPVWDIIGQLKINKVNDSKQVAVFSPQIKSLENKRISLQGYMIPIEEGISHKHFLLSTLPVNQCYYCGKNGVPIMIEVQLDEPVKFTYKPIFVTGTFKLNYGNAADNIPIYLTKAEVEE